MYVFYYLITIIILWRRCRRGMANIIIVLNVKYVILVSTLVNQLEYVVNAQRQTVNPSPHLPDVTKSVLALFAIVPVSCFRNRLENGVCDNSKSPDPCGQWFIGPLLYHEVQCQVVEICFLQLCVYSKHDWHWNKTTHPRS